MKLIEFDRRTRAVRLEIDRAGSEGVLAGTISQKDVVQMLSGEELSDEERQEIAAVVFECVEGFQTATGEVLEGTFSASL